MDIGTVVSLVSAVAAAGSAGFAYWSIHDDRKRRRREQATKVSGWVAREHGDSPWQARIRNHSDLPVYDVRVCFHEMERLAHSPAVGSAWRVADRLMRER
jgi:hypothetical protein